MLILVHPLQILRHGGDLRTWWQNSVSFWTTGLFLKMVSLVRCMRRILNGGGLVGEDGREREALDGERASNFDNDSYSNPVLPLWICFYDCKVW